MESKFSKNFQTKKVYSEEMPRFYLKEPIVVIPFSSKGRNVKEGIVLGIDLGGNPENGLFSHTFSCLQLFRHQYITECYDADPVRLWLMIPDYSSDLVSFLSTKSNFLKFKAIRQIFKLALFFESMKLMDYHIDLDEVFYEDFGKSFSMKFYNFSGSWFGETGILKKKSALGIVKSMEKILGLIENDSNNNELVEEKREVLKRIMLYDTISIEAVDNFFRKEKLDNLWYVHFIKDLLFEYSYSEEIKESSLILRKISKVILSNSLRKIIKKNADRVEKKK